MRPKNDAAVYRPDLGVRVMEYVETMATAPIGLQVMPIYETTLNASTFPVIPVEALLKLPDTKRAMRGNYGRDDWEYERGKFACDENGWEEPVDDGERKLVEGEIYTGAADEMAVDRSMGIVMKSQEKRIADKVFNATNFTANAVTTEWDTAATCTPVDDVNDGINTVRMTCGMLPNALVISFSTFLNLKVADQVVDKLKYTFPGIDLNRMTSAQLAQVFNVDRVLVGGSVYDSAKKGKAASISDLWSNEYAMLTRVASGRNIKEPCIGRTFLWTEDSAVNAIVESYREEAIKSDVFRVRHNTDEKLLTTEDNAGTEVSDVAQACSYLLSNIHT